MASNSADMRARSQSDEGRGEQRAAKRTLEIKNYSNTVTILVGPEEEQFMLHEDVLCAKSDYFKASCSSEHGKKEESIYLPQVGPSNFEAYCSWVYIGELPENDCTDASTISAKEVEINSAIELFVLGDVLEHRDCAIRP